MQRGILSLTKQESKVAIELSNISTQDLATLASKLELALSSSEDISTIEVNREEVEALLDAMPIPSETENPVYKLLRNKLSMFLASKNE